VRCVLAERPREVAPPAEEAKEVVPAAPESSGAEVFTGDLDVG